MMSAVIDAERGLSAGFLERETGVRSRYVCRHETQIDLAVSACSAALDNAGIDPSSIQLLLSGSGVPYQPLPAMAPLIMQRLGISDGTAAAFDVNATCLGFLTALDIAAMHIASGRCETALVVSSDVASRALPWADEPQIAALFGDGAAAAVLRKAAPGEGAICASVYRTYSSAYDACSIGAGGTRFDFRTEAEAFARHAVFRMDGKSLFQITARHFRGFVEDLLSKAGWSRDDVDLVVPHQASPHALAHMARLVGFAPEQLIDISRDHGNQIAASMPFAFDVARRLGRVPPGARVLFLGTSAGVSFGGMAMQT